MTAGSATGVPVRLLPMGEEALLVEVDDTGEHAAVDGVLALRAACVAAAAAEEATGAEDVTGAGPRGRSSDARSPDGGGPWADVEEVVAAARTVLLVTRPGADLAALGSRVLELATGVRPTDPTEAASGTGDDAGVVEIAVRYDGPDLDEVAGITGLSREEVVAAHTGTPWRVGFGGFAPGFAYLVGGDARLTVPRRAEPRTRVPAGAVGLAGDLSGIYPRPSPGGWQLIGTTDAQLWDVQRDPPALLSPGLTVRFVQESS